MTKSKMANRYSPEVRARAVRMVFEHQGSYETQAGAIAAIAPKIGCIPQTLREWVKQAEKDSGKRDGVTRKWEGLVPTIKRLYPDGVRPSWKMLAKAVNAESGDFPAEATLRRAWSAYIDETPPPLQSPDE